MKPKQVSKPFLLIDTFAQIWSKAYGGQIYEKTPRDFREAKVYLELNEDFSPDNIVSKAKIYLSKGGFYSDVRHNFFTFINNISQMVDEMPGKYRTGESKTAPVELGQLMKKLVPLYHCHDCGQDHTEEKCPQCKEEK